MVQLLDRLKRLEATFLVALVLVAGGLWGFAELADEVVEGQTHVLDTRILLWFRNPADPSDPLGPGWIEETARDFTALGGTGIVMLITLASVIFLLLQGKRHALLLLLFAVVGGLVASTLLKLGFDRPRPDLVPHGAVVYTASFPSGHSMMSAVVYLTLGALLARVQHRRSTKLFLLGMAVSLALLVGVSRVYLGVHWPTDVLAGWTAGAVWALGTWIAATALQRRGKVENAPAD